MRDVAPNTRAAIRRFVNHLSRARIESVVDRIRDREYAWPYKHVTAHHVAEVLEDMGLQRVQVPGLPYDVWCGEEALPTPRERGLLFLQWLERNRRSSDPYSDEHYYKAEGHEEATEEILDQLRFLFPEIFAAPE